MARLRAHVPAGRRALPEASRRRMTDTLLVLRKLGLLREAVERLRAWRPESADELRATPMLRDAIALNVLVVVSEAIDIAFHVATDEGWGVPGSYREGFE